MQNKQQNTKYAINIPIRQNHNMEPLALSCSDTTSVASRITWLLVLGVKLSCVLCTGMWTHTMTHFMFKYSQYAICAITYLECTICKRIPNMPHMQKYPTYAIYAKYASYAKTSNTCNVCKNIISNKKPKYAINIPIRQNHTMEPLAVTERQ